jgi:hypothetical protein
MFTVGAFDEQRSQVADPHSSGYDWRPVLHWR